MHDETIVWMLGYGSQFGVERNRIFLAKFNFNSIVKKWPELLYTNRSGVPCAALFSTRVNDNSQLFLMLNALISCQNLVSPLIIF